MTLQSKPHIAPDEIRAIRERLGLTQVGAGELFGGGSRAFTKYEAGKVRPAASVVQLLRLLDANPNALDGLRSGGGVISPREPVAPTLPFEIDGQDISVFTVQTMPLLLRRLLGVEAKAHGLPEYDVHVSGNIYAADGGEDGHIFWNGGPPNTSFLPSQLSAFQLKAGDISPGKAGREVLTKGGAVKPMVRSVLERGGNYIVLCARSYTHRQIETREERIRKAVRDGGTKIADGQVDFRDADQIASWVNSHPSVAAWVKEATRPGTIGPFRSWNHSANRAEHLDSPWAEDERLPALRGLVREAAADPHRIVRVLGPSGVGKSRLVLEALRLPEEVGLPGFSLADLVLYADESEFGASAVNTVVQTLAEHRQRAVVVIDNCVPETHRILAGMVRRDTSRLSLITLDHEIPRELTQLSRVDVDERETMVRVPEAPLSVVEAVVRAACPSLRSEDFGRLVRFSDGFPKVGRLVAQAWALSRPVAHATEEHLTETFVLGHRDSERDEMLRSARLLAAFRLVSLEQQDGDLAQVAEFGRRLSSRDLRIMFVRMVARGVALRRGRYVALQPPAIAANLAEVQWTEWDTDDWDSILGGDTHPGLKVNAAKQLRLLNTTGIAAEVAGHVCRPGGPFDGRDGLLKPGHAEVLHSLAQVAPLLVANRIERSLNGIADLSDIRGEGRRHLVRALEKIAFAEESFEAGAILLLCLAVAENEHWGNNATGQFKALFPVLLGDTAADGDARLAFLKKMLDQPSGPEQRRILVEALIEGSATRNFSRSVGAEIHGARPALEPWRPSTWKEARAYIEGCVVQLSDCAVGDGPAADIARSGLGKRLSPLASSGFLNLVEEAVGKVAPQCDLWPEAIEALWNFLVHGIPKLPAGPDREDTERRIPLLDGLKPKDPEAQVRALVTEMPWDYLRESGETDHEQLHRRQVGAVREFAAKLLENPEHVRVLLPQLNRLEAPAGGRSPKRMTFVFGQAVAELSQAPMDWLEPIAQALRNLPEDRRDFELLAGYLMGLPCKHAAAVEAFKRRMAGEPELAPALPQVCLHLRISASDIALVLSPLRAALLPPWRLRHWSFGSALKGVDARVVAPLFDALLDHGDEGYRSALELMGMYAFQRLDVLEGLRPQLRKVAENLGRQAGERDPFVMVDPVMQAHHFGELMKWLLERGRDDPDARAAAMALSHMLVDQWDNALEDMIKPVLRLVLGKFPEIAWQIIGDAVLADPAGAWRLEALLGGQGSLSEEDNGAYILSLPEDVLFAWCRRNGAPAFAASLVPVLGTCAQEGREASLHPWTARLLDEFGDNEGMLDAFRRNIFSFTGWGSPAGNFASYELPLAKLRDGHHSLNVRRWAEAMLRELSDEGERDRAREEEWKARHES